MESLSLNSPKNTPRECFFDTTQSIHLSLSPSLVRQKRGVSIKTLITVELLMVWHDFSSKNKLIHLRLKSVFSRIQAFLEKERENEEIKKKKRRSQHFSLFLKRCLRFS